MTLSNQITISRILAIPFALVLVLQTNPTWFLVGFILCFIIGFSDFLDGYLARKHGQITETGKFLDPLADKIFFGAAATALVGFKLFPAWILGLMLVREFLVTEIRIIAIQQHVEVQVSGWGKAKTFAQFLTLFYLGLLRYLELNGTLCRPFSISINIAKYFLFISVASLTVLSMMQYIKKHQHIF